jgi:hypothetical protein
MEKSFDARRSSWLSIYRKYINDGAVSVALAVKVTFPVHGFTLADMLCHGLTLPAMCGGAYITI